MYDIILLLVIFVGSLNYWLFCVKLLQPQMSFSVLLTQLTGHGVIGWTIRLVLTPAVQEHRLDGVTVTTQDLPMEAAHVRVALRAPRRVNKLRVQDLHRVRQRSNCKLQNSSSYSYTLFKIKSLFVFDCIYMYYVCQRRCMYTCKT